MICLRPSCWRKTLPISRATLTADGGAVHALTETSSRLLSKNYCYQPCRLDA